MPRKKISERELIDYIRKHCRGADNTVVKAIGDDCAVVRAGEGRVSLITTDTLVENVHYDSSWHPPRELGRKSASVNISDIAAMGGLPRFALLSLALTPDVSEQWVERFLGGFQEALQDHHVALIGGDTVKSCHENMISVTVIGETEADRVLYRSGAKPGDIVWVSGPLGEAAAGLALCRKGLAADARFARLIKAHLDPDPQVQLGRVLSASGMVHAMMDISDGLATDLAHICEESGAGAEVISLAVPVAEDTVRAAAVCHASTMDWALKGGEDYQLLFTCGENHSEALMKLVEEETGRRIYPVARIVKGAGVTLYAEGEPIDITYQGYEHFR